MRALALAALVGAALGSAAFARCEGVVPQPKPQNTFPQDIGRSYERIEDEGWIEFAAYDDFRPWSWQEKGVAQGVDIDLGRMIAADLGLEPRFRLVQAGETLEADLQNYVWRGAAIGGRVSDVMLHVPYDSLLTCRVEQVVFTGQYATERIAIAYRLADYPEKGPVPAYFRFYPVGVENDSISDFYLTSLIGSVDKIHRYPTPEAAMAALAAAEVMAVMAPRGQVQAGVATHPDAGLAVHQPPLVGFARGSWTLGIGISQQHRDLAYAVDGVIEAALADGRIATIFAAHGLDFEPPDR